MPIKTSGVIIKNGDNKYLLQLRTDDAPSYKNQWLLFGGHCEGDETFLETAKRELKEELNLDFSDDRFTLLGDDISPDEKGEDIYSKIYLLTIKPEEKIKLGEGADFGFFTKEEALALPIPDHMVSIINRYF